LLINWRRSRNNVPYNNWNRVPIASIDMKKAAEKQADMQDPSKEAPRRMRADAQRKMGSLLQAATEVFTTSGVDAPVREIAERAGVGLGTVYRHFPQRSDLIVAVMRTQMDACADAATALASEYEPGEALIRWLHRFMDFFATKRGLAAALHSGDPAYSALPGYFLQRMHVAAGSLLDAAVAAKIIRPAIKVEDLVMTVATLCHGPNGEEPPYARKMVELIVEGLRFEVHSNPLPK
jgi:AcrR family transcriptional regulator